MECARHGDCEKCEYPYYTLDGRCELSCPRFYKEEYPRRCEPEYVRNADKLTDTFEVMMWVMMFLLCGFFLFCGMLLYQYYVDLNDEDNIYGSGVHRITKYETALA